MRKESGAAQVWRTPGLGKSVAPMQLHRTYGGCHGDIAALDWSADSQWIAVASKDLTARRGPRSRRGRCFALAATATPECPY